jgi:hypothetical protein
MPLSKSPSKAESKEEGKFDRFDEQELTNLNTTIELFELENEIQKDTLKPLEKVIKKVSEVVLNRFLGLPARQLALQKGLTILQSAKYNGMFEEGGRAILDELIDNLADATSLDDIKLIETLLQEDITGKSQYEKLKKLLDEGLIHERARTGTIKRADNKDYYRNPENKDRYRDEKSFVFHFKTLSKLVLECPDEPLQNMALKALIDSCIKVKASVGITKHDELQSILTKVKEFIAKNKRADLKKTVVSHQNRDYCKSIFGETYEDWEYETQEVNS